MDLLPCLVALRRNGSRMRYHTLIVTPATRRGIFIMQIVGCWWYVHRPRETTLSWLRYWMVWNRGFQLWIPLSIRRLTLQYIGEQILNWATLPADPSMLLHLPNPDHTLWTYGVRSNTTINGECKNSKFPLEWPHVSGEYKNASVMTTCH
jgi:hypothetical protein